MKGAKEIEASASKPNAHLPPMSTEAAQTRSEKPPRIREEHRQSVFLCFPDELFREIGKHMPLEHWVALRQLCKALSEQVDRQPPFILLDPDVQTDKLFRHFLEAHPVARDVGKGAGSAAQHVDFPKLILYLP